MAVLQSENLFGGKEYTYSGMRYDAKLNIVHVYPR